MEEFIVAPGSISGAGGKGGGGSTATEAENTLRSSAVARIVEVISEGPIEGIAGGAAGIYINDTPLFNADGSTNFARALWDYRVGLPSQDYMPGFNAVQAEVIVGAAVTIATNNIIQAVSSTLIDAVNVTIQLPNGLTNQDLTNGDLNGSDVQFRIDTRLGTGTWATYGTYTITGKTTSVYEASYRISRPAGSGLWSVRVTRITADPPANIHNQTIFARMTEIQEVQVSYPDTAVVGLAIDAETVGNQIPKRSYLVKGVLVDIPSNLNPATRVYTGAWDGTFVTTTTAFDNPVWALYDVMTNTRYGAGIDPAKIDIYSFYDASVYCDASVTYTPEGGTAQTEPRYTFNARIADRPELMTLVNSICGSMAANLIYWNGKWTLIQDRPTSVSKLITKANTTGGFSYKSSGLYERHTAVNVTFNDRNDRYLQRVVTVEDSTGIARYGYTTTDIAAFGATTEGQAIRAGKWALDSELNQSELADFQMSLNGFDLTPGDIVNIYDEDYANNTGAGRIVSYTPGSTTLTLDRACVITSGSTVSAILADGHTIETKSIVGTGTLSVLTLSSAFSTALFAQGDFIVTSSISPRPFKIINITVPDPGTVKVEAVSYDPGKFARVESGITVPSGVFTNQVTTVVPAPTSLVFSVESKLLPSGLPRRYLRLSWTPPTTGSPVAGYNVTWARNSANRQSTQVDTFSALIPADEDGIYAVSVYTRDFQGNVSGLPLSGSYTLSSNVTTGDTTGFAAPINLVAQDSNGTTWTQNDLIIKWADATTNTRAAIDYKVEVYTTADVLLRTEVVAGESKRFTYTLAMNTTDGSGTPRISLKIKVYGRDTENNYSLPNTVTFTNPAPAAITGFNATGMYKAAALQWNQNTEADLQGYYVWRGTSSGFTPSSGNLVYTGLATKFLDGVLADTTTYYYKVAGFDRFSHAVDGTNLNIVSANTSSSATPGVTSGTSNPGSGTEGDLFYNTTDHLLYKYSSGVWRVVGMFQGTTTQMNAKTGMVTGDLWSNTTDGKLYRYSGSAWVASVATVDLTGQITTTQITDDAVTTPKLIAGSVTTTKIATGAVTANEIAANTITAAKIAAGTITANEIAASTITGGKIAASTITTGNIQAGAVTAASGIIADLAVSTLKIAGNAVTIPVAKYVGGGPYFMTSLTQPILQINLTVPSLGYDVPIICTMSAVFRGGAVWTVMGGEAGQAWFDYYPFRVALYRDGTEIYRTDRVGDMNGAPFSATIVDNCPAGAHTYTWWGQVDNYGSGFSWTDSTQAFYMSPCLTLLVAQR